MNPHVLDGNLYVEGAVLTICPGTIIEVQPDAGLYVSYGDEPAGLMVLGTEEDQVLFRSSGTAEPGAWSGIAIFDAADDTALHISHTTIAHAGGHWMPGALTVYGATPTVTGLTVTESVEYGFYFTEAAGFAAESSGISVTDSAIAGRLPFETADTMPEAGADIQGNTDDQHMHTRKMPSRSKPSLFYGEQLQ